VRLSLLIFVLGIQFLNLPLNTIQLAYHLQDHIRFRGRTVLFLFGLGVLRLLELAPGVILILSSA
jgi:hypothetical protein